MAKKIKPIEPLIMLDDVSPVKTIPRNKVLSNKTKSKIIDDIKARGLYQEPKTKSMKKTTKYYKKKKRAFVEIINEYNNFFILPAVRLWYDRAFDGSCDKLFFEISWLNYTVAFKIKN